MEESIIVFEQRKEQREVKFEGCRRYFPYSVFSPARLTVIEDIRKFFRTMPALFHMQLLAFFLVLSGCSSEGEQGQTPAQGALIVRKSDQKLYLPPPQKNPPPTYIWDEQQLADIPRVTLEYFRCKGTSLNPERFVDVNGKATRFSDCGGSERHSLPLKDQKEFIYPILINLLNHIQASTGKRVVITSGHRCPEHNTYVDPSVYNSYSKHTIGAEVSFYVLGMEEEPEAIVEEIIAYYRSVSAMSGNSEYSNFLRYEKSDTNVSTMPWYNKEVFIKLFKATEGRNIDNRHPYPYLSIQVRFDPASNQRVTYSWDKAYKNYLRK